MTIEHLRNDFVHSDKKLRMIDYEIEDEELIQPVSLFSIENEEADEENVNDDHVVEIAKRVSRLTKKLENAEMHEKLKNDLTHHLYNVYRKSN